MNDKIQSAADSEIKPKVDANESNYKLVDLKKDIESIRDRFVADYPVDLVF